MRAMIIAFAAIFVVAICADLGLDHIGFSTEDRTTGTAVRLG
ncbi:MAG: hypothetical protein OXI81_11090 [Paracoccaceae bacterium]|nr:hypothetical protein [Paracoccaceae bacterium]MDE2911379.1 hypothetical protein [Paracoccaceae bacterium]